MPPAAATAARDEAVVGPLVRGLAVLRALVTAGGQASPGELVRRTGLARSTVDRVLSTLSRVGYLRLTGRDAELTPRLLELGNAYLAACRLPDTLGPLAERLGADLDESVSLAVPDGIGARFVYQSPRRRSLSQVFHVGDLLPADRGAPGALFATHWTDADWQHWRAHADDDRGYTVPPAPEHTRFAERVAQARQHGMAVDDQLIEPGLLAVAVPVHDAAGRVVCALSAVSHTSRHNASSLVNTALPGLRRTVAAMERELATRPEASPPPTQAPPAADWLRASKQELGPEFVESLGRGLAVLTVFDEHHPALPLTAVAEATGLARATARRALHTLVHLGYVTAEGRLFRPTPRVLELGFSRLSTLTLAQLAQPHLAELVARVHDSASMAVLADDDIRYVARVHTVRIMSVTITLGTRFPAYATALGRVLLAGLPEAERARRLAALRPRPLTRHTVTDPTRLAEILAEVDRAGHALVDQELEDGLRSIAVPVRDRAGRVVAAINVSLHAARQPAERSTAELLPALRHTAARIAADLAVASRFARITTG